MELINRKATLGITIVISILITAASFTGLFLSTLYNKEAYNWQIQTIGQDIINLGLVVPILVVSAMLMFDRYRVGARLWAGCLLYLVYTYLIYCFNIHFNNYFIEYCIILGASFFLLLYYLYVQVKNDREMVAKSRINKAIGLYFVLLPLVFYILWLSDILPALHESSVPEAVESAGLFTNPVQVIDLSVMLPGVFITGVLLLKGHRLGEILAPLVLVFFVLMDITIATLVIFMDKQGIETNSSIAVIMTLLCLLSMMLFFIDFRRKKFSI